MAEDAPHGLPQAARGASPASAGGTGSQPAAGDTIGVACPLCGTPGSTTWLLRGEWRYRQCAACSSVWLDPLPSESWAEDFYDDGYFEGGGRGGYRDYLADENQHLANARARIELARRFAAAAPGLWLDVGCAAGYTLAEARSAGFDVRGIDVSPWARKIARQRFQLEVYPSMPDAVRQHAGQASVVTMFQVLEHLPDPLAELEQARACLRPGGLLLVETWDRGSLAARLFGKRWQQITPPSVAWLFDRKSLEYVLRRAGFETREILATTKAVSVRWACGLLAEKLPATPSSVLSRIARSRFGQLELNYRFGDLVTAVAIAA